MMNRPAYLFIFLFSVSALTGARIVYAAAGDSIGNIATVNYIYQATPRVQESSPTGNIIFGVGQGSTTNFIEDALVNFSVSSSDAAAVTVVTGQTDAVLTFVITNNGNSAQDFLLTSADTTPNPFGGLPENIDTVTTAVFVEDGTNPGYQLAEDIETYVDELPANASITVYLVSSIPAASPDDLAAVSLVVQVAAGGSVGVEGIAITNDHNGNISPAGTFSNGITSVVAGTASTVADTATLQFVFNDPAGLNPEDIDSAGTGAQDAARNGQHSSTGAYVIQSASAVVVSKTVTVIDTLGGNDPHQGATLRYQLDVSISGSGGISDLVITDPIPANTTYTPASISLNSVLQTDVDFATDGIDYARFDGTDVVVDLSEQGVKSLTSTDSPMTIIFDVTID